MESIRRGGFSVVGLANRRDGWKTIREEKIYFRRVCRHAIGTTDEGLLLAAANNNTYFHVDAAACTRIQVDDNNAARTMAMTLLYSNLYIYIMTTIYLVPTYLPAI